MKHALVMLMLLAGAAHGEEPSFSADYWDRGWGFPDASIGYMLSLKVPKLLESGEKVINLLSKNQGTPVGTTGSGPTTSGLGSSSWSISFVVPAGAAEQLTKDLVKMGSLQSINVVHYGVDDPIKEIDERLQLVSREIDGNQAALAKMPVARFFLNQQREKLAAIREKCLASSAKAIVNVELISKDSSVR